MVRLKVSWLQLPQLLCSCFLLHFVVLALCALSLSTLPALNLFPPLWLSVPCQLSFLLYPSHLPVCHSTQSAFIPDFLVFVTVFWTSPLWGDLDFLLLLHWICLLVQTIHPGFDPCLLWTCEFPFDIINHIYWTSVPAASAFGSKPPFPRDTVVTKECSESTLLLWHRWADSEEFIVSNISKPAEEIMWFWSV